VDKILIKEKETMPLPRAGHSANIINSEEIVIFAGGDGSNYLRDLFCYNIKKKSWKEIKATSSEKNIKQKWIKNMFGL